MMSPSAFVNIWTSQGSTIPEEHIYSAFEAKIKTRHSIGKINHMLYARLILRFGLPVHMKNVKGGQWANPWSFVFWCFVCGLHTAFRNDLLLLPFRAWKEVLISAVKEIVNQKMTILSSFTYNKIILHLYEFISSVEHKRRNFLVIFVQAFKLKNDTKAS